jgi:biopolymer transport protein ExbB
MMTTSMLAATAPQGGESGLGSLYDMILGGGPLMVPLGVCSVIALAYAVERWIRLRSGLLGKASHATAVVHAVREGGVASGIELCSRGRTPLERILGTALHHAEAPMLEREKAVEDTGNREVKRLSANLQPLVTVAMIAPLLGLLGTVWGMIQAFSSIALRDGLGNPEALASGISQALVTTAAGLAIAIPTQALYYYFKSRIERFARRAEDGYQELTLALASAGGAEAGGEA